MRVEVFGSVARQGVPTGTPFFYVRQVSARQGEEELAVSGWVKNELARPAIMSYSFAVHLQASGISHPENCTNCRQKILAT